MKKRFFYFLYNLDRAGASLAFGTSQETISSQVGRIAIGAGKPEGWTPKHKWQVKIATSLAGWLDRTTWLWGKNHTKNAIYHADQLDHADDGKEQ